MENSFELIIAFLGRDLVSGVIHGISAAISHLSGTTGAAATGFNKFGMRASEATAAIGAAMIVAGIAVAAGMYKMAEAATVFQSKMVLVSTHAGWTRAEVDKFSNSVLTLASITGKSAEEIAGGLFYVASAGFHGAQAFEILAAATKEAAMGHTEVEATSRALTSVLLVGIKAASGASRQLTDVNETINLLNETIGHGKMKLSELNAALSTGILESARVFGVGMNEVGGALDVLTNHGMRADEAATRLRMSFALMGAPSGAAMSNLKALGLTSEAAKDQIGAYNNVITKAKLSTSQLATEMREHGLIAAIKLLNEHLHAAGLSADQANALFVRAFGGGRSATAIMALQQHLKEFQDDTDQIKNHAGDFAAKWANYTNTMEAQTGMMKESWHSAELALGMALIPMVTKLLQTLNPVLQKFAVWVQEHSELIAKIAPLVAIGLTVIGVILLIGGALGVLFFAIGGIVGVIGIVVGAIAGLIGFFGGIVFAISAVAGGAATVGEALLFIMGPVGWIIAGIILLIAIGVFLITHWKQVQAVAHTVGTAIGNAFKTAVTFVTDAINAIISFVKANWPIILAVVLGPLGLLIDLIALNWGTITTTIKNALTVIGSIIGGTIAVIVAIWNAAVTVAVATFTAIAAAFMIVVRVLKVVWDVVTTVLRVYLIVVLILIMLFVRLLQGVWTFAWNVITTSIRTFGQVLGWLKDRFVDFFNAVIAFLTPFWTALVNAFTFIRTVIINAFNTVNTFVRMVWTAIWNFVRMVITREVQGIQNILTMLRSFFTMIWNAIYNFVAPIVQAIWNVISSVFNNVLTTVTTVVTSIANTVKVWFTTAWNFISTIVNSIWNTVSSVFNNVKNTATSIISSMVNAIVNLWNNLSRSIGDALGDIWHTITSTISRIAGDALNLAADIGTNIVNGIINGLKAAWSGLVNTFNNLASQLPGPIKSVLGIKSPSSVFAKEVGMPISQGIATGITQSAKIIHTASADAVEGAIGAANKAMGAPLRGFSSSLTTMAMPLTAVPNTFGARSGTSMLTGPISDKTLADALVRLLTNRPGGSTTNTNKTMNPNITINVKGDGDPKKIADAVRDELVRQFGN